MTKKIEYRMVVMPSAEARALGLRPRHFTYPKRDYGKAKKGIEDFAKDKSEGRFEKTWKQNAEVFIEAREVTSWARLDMGDVSTDL